MNEQVKKFTEEMAKALRERLSQPDAQENIQKIKSAKSDNGRFKVVISTSGIDRHGESVNQAGWDLENYRKNPVVLWSHDQWSMPIGMCDNIGVIDGKLVAEGSFAPAEANPFAQQVRAAYDAGIVSATSVGFIVKEMVGNEITQAELLEFSFVPVPANAEVEDLMKQRELNFAEFVAKGIISKVKEGEPVDNKPEEPKTDPETPAATEGAEATPAPAATEPTEEEKALQKKKDVEQEDAGKIMAEMQSKIDTAITDAGLALQEALSQDDATDKANTESKEKAGRVLSDANRKKVKAVIDSLNQLSADLQDLYDSTEAAGGKGIETPIEQKASPEPKVEAPEGAAALMKSLDDELAMRKILRDIDNVVGSSLESINKKIKERNQKK